MADIAPEATKKEWPGWQFSTWQAFWSEKLPPVWYKPPFSTLTREEMLEHAWEHPLSYEGMMMETMLSIREIVDNDSILAAQRLSQNMSNKVEPQGSWSITGDNVAALVIPNTYQVAIIGQQSGQDMINVIGVTGASSGLAQEAAQAVQTAYKATGSVLSTKPSNFTLVEFRATDLSSIAGGIASIADATAGTGGVPAAGYLGACALVKWNGGSRSRSSRGRLYHGSIAESQINADGRTLAPASQTFIRDAYNVMRNSLSAAGFPLCVISRKLATTYPVSSVAVESVLATQRRRVR